MQAKCGLHQVSLESNAIATTHFFWGPKNDDSCQPVCCDVFHGDIHRKLCQRSKEAIYKLFFLPLTLLPGPYSI